MPAEARRWPAAAGAWLGIGTAPATLVLGAAMADRHGGAVPVAGLLLGVALMVALLYGQGRLGLLPPLGDGGTLTAVAPGYLGPVSRTVLTAVLAAAMIGWNGFNVGLGGASLAALLALPGWAGPVLLGSAVLAVSFAPPRWGNRVAVVTTLCAVALVAFCVVALPPPAAPLTGVLGGGPAPALADTAALVGYVAVFGVRAPDFSAGLARRRDLVWCVGLLAGPAVLGVLAGVGLWLRSGSADVVAVLADGPGLAGYANLFVAVAVFAAALTTTYSGALALRGIAPRVPPAVGIVAVAVFGAALAVARFDRYLLPWLTLLAAALPALVVPMATEAVRRRRRGARPRRVPAWCWLPAAVLAVALTSAGWPQAPLAGLAAAAALTMVWRARTGHGGRHRRDAPVPAGNVRAGGGGVAQSGHPPRTGRDDRTSRAGG